MAKSNIRIQIGKQLKKVYIHYKKWLQNTVHYAIYTPMCSENVLLYILVEGSRVKIKITSTHSAHAHTLTHTHMHAISTKQSNGRKDEQNEEDAHSVLRVICMPF